MVVEDDATLRQALSLSLGREGYEVVTASDGARGLEIARGEGIDLILLDVMLPGMSGLELLRALRRHGRSTPVIVLSAKADELDRVVGLRVGADDYVTKPFSRPELLARVEALLRRSQPGSPDAAPGAIAARDRVAVGELTIDRARREARLGGRELQLATREFDLLAHLAAQPGRVFTREQLLAAVWGYDYAGDGRTIDVHVSWLRGKLRAIDGRDHIRTVRGVGYALATFSGGASG